MNKTSTLILIALGLLAPVSQGADTFKGLIFNHSNAAVSDQVIRYLTPRWHFSSQTPNRNLEVSDIKTGTAIEKLVFTYGGEPILQYTIPKARLKQNELIELADKIYTKTIKADVKQRYSVLQRLAVKNQKKGANP